MVNFFEESVHKNCSSCNCERLPIQFDAALKYESSRREAPIKIQFLVIQYIPSWLGVLKFQHLDDFLHLLVIYNRIPMT